MIYKNNKQIFYNNQQQIDKTVIFRQQKSLLYYIEPSKVKKHIDYQHKISYSVNFIIIISFVS